MIVEDLFERHPFLIIYNMQYIQAQPGGYQNTSIPKIPT
jgi:hypothetical protein